jgi:histo-blood group ABO system transferase
MYGHRLLAFSQAGNRRRIFFPADILLFTDSPSLENVKKQVYIKHQGWPNATLMRYHLFLSEQAWLAKYDHIFYLDIDMIVVGKVGDEILADGITATIHASYARVPKSFWTPEENIRSTACLSKDEIRKYYTGCFIGGKRSHFATMCETLARCIDIDNEIGFIATWHDESHLNRYLYDHPPALELGDDFNAWYRTATTKIGRVNKALDGKVWANRPEVNGIQP